jgi:protein TonB
MSGYAKIIQRRILENLNYPDSAREAGFQGTVKLSLHLSYQGELLEAILKESSGYKILDDQAVNVAQEIVSYPPFPSSVEQEDLWIDVPIVYKLD